jgi:catechol 2,3-dioxygenase-like lactoylglutathione lyase family enzyme
MLSDKDVSATIAVKDLSRARKFYEGTLGLEVLENMEPGGIVYKSGRSPVLVYKSTYAGTNKATAATWVVGGSVDEVVHGLKGRGVTFEHYDLPDITREGDVHVAGELRVAWLKDPDGNILALSSR